MCLKNVLEELPFGGSVGVIFTNHIHILIFFNNGFCALCASKTKYIRGAGLIPPPPPNTLKSCLCLFLDLQGKGRVTFVIVDFFSEALFNNATHTDFFFLRKKLFIYFEEISFQKCL